MLKLIVGCGYLGLRVARRWLDEGHGVTATTRQAQRAAEFQASGLRPLIRDITLDPPPTFCWPSADTVLVALGLDRAAGYSIEQLYVEGLRRLLGELPPSTGRLIYISSTGVYGQNDGQWVDEQSPCQPTRAGGKACLAAERLLMESSWGEKSVVLRLAGLYGPGRIPRRADIAVGRPVPAAAGFLNLIHVDDAVQAVLAVERRTRPAALYNVSDGHPVPRPEYFREIARLINAPPPQLVPPDPHSTSADRGSTDKRIDSQRIRRELALDLKFPSYREGLAAILADEMTSQE